MSKQWVENKTSILHASKDSNNIYKFDFLNIEDLDKISLNKENTIFIGIKEYIINSIKQKEEMSDLQIFSETYLYKYYPLDKKNKLEVDEEYINKNRITFGSLTIKDIEHINKIHNYPKGFLENCFANNNLEKYCFRDKNKIPIAWTIRHLHDQSIGALHVEPEHRRKGLATYLVNKLINNSENNFANIEIKNKASIKLFKSLGFKKEKYKIYWMNNPSYQEWTTNFKNTEQARII